MNFQHKMGLFLHSTGSSKAIINFLSCCGLSSCYSSVVKVHKYLAKSLRVKAGEIAKGPHMLGFDNVQISMSHHASQRPGAIPTVRSFTASIVYRLRNAFAGFCALRPILERRKNCEKITYAKHIKQTAAERVSFFRHIKLDVIKILFDNTKGFQTDAYKDFIKHETHRPPPSDHKTTECVNPTVEYDESKTVGVLDFLEGLYLGALGLTESILENLAIPCVNDQLTNSRLRQAYIERRGDESAFLRMENFQLGIGFFHAIMNFIWQLLGIHRGSTDIPGSASFWRDFLGTKRLVSERPDYYTLRTFFLDVLYANIMHCWSKKTGFNNLDDYANTNPTLDELEGIAQDIINEFASDNGLRACTDTDDTDSDVDGAEDTDNTEDPLLHNVIMFNRDLLFFYEFDAAISSGDFGRLELLLGVLARMFNGAGAKNYALKLLHLTQNLKLSWPENFA